MKKVLLPLCFIVLSLKGTNFVSIFGDMQVSPREDQILIMYQYGIPLYSTVNGTIGTGTITSSTNGSITLNSGIGVGNVQVQSKQKCIYNAGHETYSYFSARFTSSGGGTHAAVAGPYTNTDGVAVGILNGVFSIMFRQNGTTTFIGQSSFNVDPLNGTGPSGYTLNPATLNCYRITYGWLGASTLRFYVLSSSQEWILFHRINRTNSFIDPTFANPNLPLSAQAQSLTAGSSAAVDTACWNMGTVTANSIVANRYFNAAQPLLNVTSTETHLLTIRNKTTYQTKLNTIPILATILLGGGISSTDAIIMLRIRTNATVTGTSYTDVDTDNSVAEVSTVGTYTAGTGTPVVSLVTSSANGGPLNILLRRSTTPSENQNNLMAIIQPGETLTITGQSITGATTPTSVSLVWQEQF